MVGIRVSGVTEKSFREKFFFATISFARKKCENTKKKKFRETFRSQETLVGIQTNLSFLSFSNSKNENGS